MSYRLTRTTFTTAGARLNGGLCTDWWQDVDVSGCGTNVATSIGCGTNAAVIALVERCALIKVSVCGCKDMTDAAIIALAERCALIKVSVCGCKDTTDVAIMELGERCPALTVLDVGYWEPD